MLIFPMIHGSVGPTWGFRSLYITGSHGGGAFFNLAEVVMNLRTGGSIAGATGTPIGNMTDYGGLAAGFDGTTAQAFTSCAGRTSATGNTIGKDWGAAPGHDLISVTIYEPSNAKIDGGAPTEDVDISLYVTTDGTASGGTLVQTWTDVFNGVADSVYGTAKTLNIDTGAIT